MKFKLYLMTIVLALFAFAGIAQETDSTFAAKINRVFAGLDKTKVPHHLLKDYAMEFIDLEQYDGMLKENNFLHRGHYVSIYNTLLMARTQTEVPGLVSPEAFEDRWDALRAPNHIVLSGLYYKYSKFKENAYPNHINVDGEVISDKYVNGVWQNPYETKEVFAISPPILHYQGLSFSVGFSQSLWYTNQDIAVQSIAIDFGDGQGYREMAFGQNLQINYSEEGVYDWTYKLTFAGGTVRYSHSKMFFEAFGPTGDCYGAKQIDFSGTRQYQGVANDAILQIDYAENDCVLRKPLIVAEGFDSGLLGVENPLGENDYSNFIEEATSFTGDLETELNNYDIIYVNWKNGRDYLQRNAYLLEDIIEWVNEEKVGEEPNVVLGQSMGGVIARYALRDMENRGKNHETRLYISHDAPHQGANIPVGILAFARHLTMRFVNTPLGDLKIPIGQGGKVSISDIEGVLDDPGTQQLLKISVVEGTWGGVPDNSVHNAWQAELENMGYPQQTRNIAISNGNHCANTHPFSPADELFFMSGNGKTSFLTAALLQVLPFVSDTAFTYFTGIGPPFFLGALPGSSKYDLYCQVKAMPDIGNTARIYKGKITYTKKILWLFPITITMTDHELFSNGVILPYDYYPGGSFPVPFNVSEESSGYWGEYDINSRSVESFDFIPIPSALDVGSGNITLTDNDYLKVYNKTNPPAPPKDIPFDNFITSFTPNSTLNEVHISFNTNNGNWLAKEIEADPADPEYPPIMDCSFLCLGNTLGGSGIICDFETYTVQIPSATNVFWNVDTNGLVSYNINGDSITITRMGSTSNGEVTLSAYYDTPTCKDVLDSRKIIVGAPDLQNLGITGNDNVPTHTFLEPYTANSTIHPGANYIWSIDYNGNTGSNLPVFTASGTNTITTPSYEPTVTIEWGNNPGSYMLRCEAENACGDFTLGTKWINVYVPGEGEDEDLCDVLKLIISPNPSSGSINVEAKHAPIDPPCPPEYGNPIYNLVTIHNLSGNLIYSNHYETMEFTIRDLNLESGEYILNFITSNEKRGQEIIIFE